MDDEFDAVENYPEPLDNDEQDEPQECPQCYGSGGGPEYWRCSYCGGKGVVR